MKFDELKRLRRDSPGRPKKIISAKTKSKVGSKITHVKKRGNGIKGTKGPIKNASQSKILSETAIRR